MSESLPDYYGILGIDRDADAQAIKRAYRKLAKTWHPDRVAPEDKEAATKKFKEINEAYAVLSDPQKKRQYDNPMPQGFGRGSQHPFFDDSFDPFSVFESFFRDQDDFFGSAFGASRRSSSRRRGDRGMAQHRSPFGDSFFGGGLFDSTFGSFDRDFGGMGSSMSSSFSSFGGPSRGSFRSSSVSTQIVNGRRRTVKTTQDNNGTTKEIYEDNTLIERWQNGEKTFDLAIEGVSSNSSQRQAIRSSERRPSARRYAYR